MPSRGEIYFVSLDPVKGREQAGRRPVLVVSSNAINRQPLVVTVIPGTDSRHVSHDYTTNVRVLARDSGLPFDTVFLCFQMRSIDPSRIVGSPSGRLPESAMIEVEKAMRVVLEL